MAANGHATVAAILVAAGVGQRLGAQVPKAFVEVAGRSLLEHAVSAFAGHPDIDEVVVVVAPNQLERAGRLAAVPAVAGGADRQESVAAGLAAAPDVDFVLVHDVARPFVPPAVIDAVLDALRTSPAVVPVVPMHDTVRRLGPHGALGEVVDRATLVAVQTPQGFHRSVLAEAHERGVGIGAGDDAALVQRLGVQITSVPGSDDAFKITTPADLARAEAIAQLRFAAPPAVRPSSSPSAPGGTAP